MDSPIAFLPGTGEFLRKESNFTTVRERVNRTVGFISLILNLILYQEIFEKPFHGNNLVRKCK
jgi:hypothetical protein